MLGVIQINHQTIIIINIIKRNNKKLFKRLKKYDLFEKRKNHKNRFNKS